LRPTADTWSPIFGMRFLCFAKPTVSHRPVPVAMLWKFKLHHYLMANG
jgi:hypothetical protein